MSDKLNRPRLVLIEDDKSRCAQMHETLCDLQFQTQIAVSDMRYVRYRLCCLRLVDDVQGKWDAMQMSSICFAGVRYQQRSFTVSVNGCWISFLIMSCGDFDLLMHFTGLQTAWNHKRSWCVPYIWPDILCTRVITVN